MEAAYYDNIIEQQRIEPEFFRMGFYGRKFPFFLRVRLGPSSAPLWWKWSGGAPAHAGAHPVTMSAMTFYLNDITRKVQATRKKKSAAI